MAAHAARDGRPSEQHEDRGQRQEDRPRRHHERQRRTQRQHHVDRRQHEHELGEARQQQVDAPARIPRDAADDAAEQRGAERGEDRQRQREPGAVHETREDVAAVAVGAEQQQRRAALGIGGHEHPAGKPAQRHTLGGDLVEPPFEAAHHALAVDEGRARAGVPQPHRRGRRIEQVGEPAVRRVRREPGRGHGRERDHGQDHHAGAPHDTASSRTRGSTAARSRSPASVPQARKAEPIAAQPATR